MILTNVIVINHANVSHWSYILIIYSRYVDLEIIESLIFFVILWQFTLNFFLFIRSIISISFFDHVDLEIIKSLLTFVFSLTSFIKFFSMQSIFCFNFVLWFHDHWIVDFVRWIFAIVCWIHFFSIDCLFFSFYFDHVDLEIIKSLF